MDALLLAVPADKGVENSEYVAAVFHHARENVAQPRFAFGFAMPLHENSWWYFDIAAQLFGGMAPKEKPIEKSGLSLGNVEIQRDFGGNELCHRSHGERAVYRKASRRQVVPSLIPPGG